MAKKPTLHAYADQPAFERLMLLVATLVQYPGIGYDPNNDSSGDALILVQGQLREVAKEAGFEWPEGYPATATIRKDMQALRDYGILERRMYRWGYYLGTGAMRLDELQVAFQALASQAKYQGNPQARRIYETLEKRLRGLDLERKGEFFYPVRQHLNRAIVYTDPEEMMAKNENRRTLFHELEKVEGAILQGQAIAVSRTSDPYGRGRVGERQIWPLQLIYHDIAWYLIYEYCHNGHLAVSRLNRFSDYCQVISAGRGLAAQQQSLARAHQLLENGWGLYLGEVEQQQAELQGELPLLAVKVRFFGQAVAFIREGECRHPRQKVRDHSKDRPVGEEAFVDYEVRLPERSLDEFLLWVNKYGGNACVLSPPQLVERHRQVAKALGNRYGLGLC